MKPASPPFHHARQLCWVALLLLLGACSGEPSTPPPTSRVAASPAEEVVKSPNDTREYRALLLDNGLKVLLISDPLTDKAAASVDVNAGSNSDPREFGGLAHFLEHMLFLGTAKYPQAGEYQDYIASHGGSHNAYTAYENTNYYFSIDQPYLAEALDRFSQFFIAPLFTQDYVDRERNAVHSEYQSGLQDDSRRGYSVLKAILNPAHPLTGFSVGSLETLQDQTNSTLRNALLAHYERYYSANLMTVAIFGAEPLDALEVLARQYFSEIPNRNRQAPLTREPLFLPGTLPAQLSIEPVRDSRSLSYTFPIPVVKEHYKAKPLNLLGHLLGHEGEGSLLAVLREKGWANGLSAGGGFSYPDNATFSVGVALTEEGVNRIDEISALLFQYIALVREQGLQQWIFDELKVMAELAFRFQEPQQPVGYVSSMSRRMQEYPAAELITAAYAYEDFDPELLQSILDRLRPDNVLLTLTARGVEGDRRDPWYDTPYRFEALATGRVAAWQSYPRETALALAPPNPFLPADLSIKPLAGAAPSAGVPSARLKPELLVDSDGVRLWFKQDNEFMQPRANFYVYALTPLFGDSLRNALLSSLVVSLVNDKLSEYSYPANLAGAGFGLSHRSRGFTLSVSGYQDKQQELLDTLLQTLVEADFAEERFAIIRTEQLRALRNAALQTPYNRLFQEIQALLVSPYWSEDERIAELESITFSDVRAFVPQMLAPLRLDALYHGNITASDAQQMLDTVLAYLPTSAAAPKPGFGTVVNLPEQTRIVQEVEIEHDDSAIVLYFQGEDDSLRTQATISLLGTILRTPFYEQLRTQEQLGYIVNAGTLPILDTNGLVLYIESPVADPLLLEERIDAFLATYSDTLATLDPAQFNDIKSGLLTSLRQPPQRMNALSGRYWSDILVEKYSEDSTLQMADAVEALTHADVLAWYQTRVAAPQASRLVARSVGRPMREQFAARRIEPEDTVILDAGNVDYLPFKQAAEQFEFLPEGAGSDQN
jgi:insulysin